jgi:hypothetical protein
VPPECCPVAWAGSIPANQEVQITFSDAYEVFWMGMDGPLPGTRVIPSQAVSVDPQGPNALTLSVRSAGTSVFSPPSSQAPSGVLLIDQDSSVPSGRAALGVATSGRTILAVPSEKRATAAFTPSPLGSALRGATCDRESGPGLGIDPAQLLAVQSLAFPPDVFNATVTLGQDGTWSVRYGP